jgi:hypothetical protein
MGAGLNTQQCASPRQSANRCLRIQLAACADSCLHVSMMMIPSNDVLSTRDLDNGWGPIYNVAQCAYPL